MKNKQLTFVLAVLMSMVASVVSAYDVKVNGIYYNLSGQIAKVTYKYRYYDSDNGYQYKQDYKDDIVIPDSFYYSGTTYYVEAIEAHAFDYCGDVTSVSIPKSIKTIGNEGLPTTNKQLVYYCYAYDVPNLVDLGGLSNSLYKRITCYVPKSKLAEYEVAKEWKYLTLVALENPVESLSFQKHGFDVFVDDAVTIEYDLLPQETYNKTVFWSSSNEEVAKVDNKGNVTTLDKGECYIYAVSEDNPEAKDSCLIKVTRPVKEVSLNYNSYNIIGLGNKIQLLANVQPQDASNTDVEWSSSDENVCTVEDGLVTGLSKGKSIITATTVDGGYTATCEITVTIAVEGITLSHNEYTLTGVGRSVQLSASVLPTEASNQSVTWSSSNENVCTVSDGKVTAVNKGTAIITATSEDGGFTASCTITVIQGVTGITLNYENYTLNNIGESVQLTATVSPDNADDKTITWASLNENVCRVTNGFVLAVGEGTTVITATSADGDVSAKCTITVKVPKAATGVTLDKETLILHAIGESAQLTANVQPEDARNKNVTWSTSNDAICMVSNTGKVVATGEGSAVVTVKTEDGGFTASCNVRVSISYPVTGITLNQESITFDVIGKSAQLVATVVPNEATEKGVTWSSSDEAVCMVSSTGFIVAVGNGTADITATTVDGGFTATCKVKVEDITPVSSVDAKAQGYKVYDLQGRERNRLQKGINIIRFSDGTTKKVLVK